jgi:uncharacterized protein YecE (DUF72 family)
VRWLGDRHKIEEQTAIWNRTLVDRTTELGEWAELIRSIGPRVSRTYAYANNHYAGFAPDTLRLFNSAWEGGLLPEAENELGGAGDSPSADDDFVLTT